MQEPSKRAEHSTGGIDYAGLTEPVNGKHRRNCLGAKACQKPNSSRNAFFRPRALHQSALLAGVNCRLTCLDTQINPIEIQPDISNTPIASLTRTSRWKKFTQH